MSILGRITTGAVGVGLVAVSGQLASQVTVAENVLLSHPLLYPQWPQPSQGVSVERADYFEAIRPSQKGYLSWTEDSVKIYVEPVALGEGEVPSRSVPVSWLKAVEGAIADWSQYVSITRTEDPNQAHIKILRRQPPLSWPIQNVRARNAETQFKLFQATDASGSPCWFHRQTIFLGDRQGIAQLEGTARHELGHALGLWGHSPEPNDVLYGQQVGNPPVISLRDLNTLKRVYEQPTELGCQ